ncbi:DUF4345 domain-containing protein [Roseibacillus persicicus]|uniref:DUF4345 domain-containing protein n=1 Tax=Roseibacillus persicicus TaxID=454148 RepID=UPI00398BB2F4
MRTKSVAIFTIVSGLILLGIGSAILLTPEGFHASNGIALQKNASLMSEIRAPGGLLFASGLLITIGSFRDRLRSQSVKLATLVYGTFGLARLLSMILDGMPSQGVIGATVIELTVAALGLVILARKSNPLTGPTPIAATARRNPKHLSNI